MEIGDLVCYRPPLAKSSVMVRITARYLTEEAFDIEVIEGRLTGRRFFYVTGSELTWREAQPGHWRSPLRNLELYAPTKGGIAKMLDHAD